MELIPEWRQAWRMASMRLMAAAVAFPGLWAVLPDEAKAALPHGVQVWIPALLVVCGMVGRLVKQPAVSGSPAAPSGFGMGDEAADQKAETRQ